MRLAAAMVTIGSIYLFAPWKFALYYLTPTPNSVQALVEEAAKQDIAGVIVYVDIKGKPAEFYASGWHNRQEQIPARADAFFKIASIAKLYDAVAVTKMHVEGRLSLDKTLADYLPELIGRIENAEQITLRMMVQHQSGIPNFTDQAEFDWSESIEDPLALALDKPALFAPGSDYSYSNTNYLLLGRIMAKQLGYDHGQYIQERILHPLGLSNTFFSVDDVNKDLLMSGYYVGYQEDLKTLDQGYVATAQDVGNFVRALNDGSLFTKQEAEVYRSLYEYGHTGWVLGYLSIARYHPDIDAVVVQFVNTNGSDTVILNNIIYSKVLDILRERDLTP